MSLFRGWLGEAKVSCILCHWGVQLRLAYSWTRPAVLAAGKGREECFYFFCFFTSIHFPLSPLSLSFICSEGWLGEAKVSCILRHRGVQLILAYS